MKRLAGLAQSFIQGNKTKLYHAAPKYAGGSDQKLDIPPPIMLVIDLTSVLPEPVNITLKI